MILDELPPSIRCRDERPEDAPFLLALYRSTRPDLAALGPAVEPLIRMQRDAREAQYRAAHPQADARILLLDEKPVGQIVLASGPVETRLVDQAIRQESRGSGLGGKILHALARQADREGRTIRLHVDNANPAMRLYARHGFVVEGEDALRTAMVRPPSEVSR